MRNTFGTTLILTLSLYFSANAQNASPDNIQKTHWLVGTWTGTFNGKPFYETWRKNKDNSLICYSVEIANGDTTVKKNSEIKLVNGDISFVDPNVFEATRIMPNEVVFEINDAKIGNSKLVWLHTGDDHWWAILQFPKLTAYYDLKRVPLLDKAIEKKLPKILNSK
jgi:hypothetical protein